MKNLLYNMLMRFIGGINIWNIPNGGDDILYIAPNLMFWYTKIYPYKPFIKFIIICSLHIRYLSTTLYLYV